MSRVKKNIHRYPLNQSQLYKCQSKRRLATLLGTDVRTLSKIARNPQYNSFKKSKKKSNEKRIISAPNSQLKQLQKLLYDTYAR